MNLFKKTLISLLNVFIKSPFVNFYKTTRYPLISDTAIEIANKIGWDKLYEKAKEAQKNKKSIINLKDYE